jgi:hypothetical protein
MGGNCDARSTGLYLPPLHSRRQRRARGENDGSQEDDGAAPRAHAQSPHFKPQRTFPTPAPAGCLEFRGRFAQGRAAGIAALHVRKWHICDKPTRPAWVRFWVLTGHLFTRQPRRGLTHSGPSVQVFLTCGEQGGATARVEDPQGLDQQSARHQAYVICCSQVPRLHRAPPPAALGPRGRPCRR